MLGQLFNWFEKANSIVDPVKVDTIDNTFPPLESPTRYKKSRRPRQPLASQPNLRLAAAASAKRLQLADSMQRYASLTPLHNEPLTGRNKAINRSVGRNQIYGGAATLANENSHETGVQLSLM